MRETMRIAGRVFNTPLMVEPGKAQAILSVLAPKLGALDLSATGLPVKAAAPPVHGDIGAECNDDEWAYGYQIISGAAVIPVFGTLIQRGSWLSSMSGLTSYGWIREEVAAAADDSNVSAIVLEIDSPGGEVSGAFDLADFIRATREQSGKPIVAVANEAAFSAAYLIAAACDRIVLPRTAGVGSIGVIALHCDMSAADKMAGLKVTAVYAGERKNDFTPHAPLSTEARAALQTEIDRVYGLFAGTVARFRGIAETAVRATEAGLLFADDAVDAGLADQIGTLDDAIASLATGAANPTTPNRGGPAMAQKPADPKLSAKAEDDKPEDETMKGEGDAPEDGEEDQPGAKKKGKAAKAKKAEGEDPEDPEDGTDMAAHAAAIADLCAKGNAGGLTATLIRERATLDQAKARIRDAGQIRTMVTAAHARCTAIDPTLAEAFIAAGASIAHVKAQLFDKVIAAEAATPAIDGNAGAAAGARGPQAIQDSWGRAFAKVSGRKVA